MSSSWVEVEGKRRVFALTAGRVEIMSEMARRVAEFIGEGGPKERDKNRRRDYRWHGLQMAQMVLVAWLLAHAKPGCDEG